MIHGGWVMLAVSLLVAAGLVELLVLLIFGEWVKFPRHVVGAPWGLRYNEPGARYRHKSADGTWFFRINRQGMRADRDYSYEKPPGVRRIIALGDSMTIGYEVDHEQTYCRVLERELNRVGLEVEVLNAGVSGFSTAEECLYLERELLKYDPDVVMIAYCSKDLDANIRTGLLRLEGDRLVEGQKTYVPAGRLGDFLNTNPVLNFLGERSNAFGLIKERLNRREKRRRVRQNLESPPASGGPAIAGAAADGEAGCGSQEYRRRLLAAIYERLYQGLHARGIPLIVQNIPLRRFKPLRLIDMFPREHFALDRPGLHYLSDLALLEPYLGQQLLFWTRSHGHMTPLSHGVIGKALAELILRDDLLGAPSPGHRLGASPAGLSSIGDVVAMPAAPVPSPRDSS